MQNFQYIVRPMVRVFDFSGRTGREEFLWFTIPSLILWWGFQFQAYGLSSYLIDGAMAGFASFESAMRMVERTIPGVSQLGFLKLWVVVAILALFVWHWVAWLALCVRRLHDVGHTGLYFVLICLAPLLVIPLVALVIGVLSGLGGAAYYLVIALGYVTPVLALLIFGYWAFCWILMFMPSDTAMNRFGKGEAAKPRKSEAERMDDQQNASADLHAMRKARMEQLR